jgi:hypothetical protein
MLTSDQTVVGSNPAGGAGGIPGVDTQVRLPQSPLERERRPGWDQTARKRCLLGVHPID